MPIDAPPLVDALFKGDHSEARRCLANGDSPNMIWGTCPLIVHAALQCDFPMFRILLDHGAILPPDFLRQVVTWDMADWMFHAGAWEGQLYAILECVRGTDAWLPLEQRVALTAEIEEFHFEWISELLKEP